MAAGYYRTIFLAAALRRRMRTPPCAGWPVRGARVIVRAAAGTRTAPARGCGGDRTSSTVLDPMDLPNVTVSLPDWVSSAVDLDAAYASDEARMRVAIELSRQ